MEKERTFILIKPDAIERRLTNIIHNELFQKGLKLSADYEILLTRENMLKWRNWPSYDEEFWLHVELMISSNVIVEIWEGKCAVSIALETKRYIRSEYAESRVRNILHCSDNISEAEEEILLFSSFKE